MLAEEQISLKAKTLTHLYNMVYGLFIMDLASLVVGDMEHYTPYTTKRSETHKKTSNYELPQEVFYWITCSCHPKRSARCRS